MDFSNSLFCGIAFALGWILKQLHTKAVITNLRHQNKSLEQQTLKFAGDNLDRLQQKRKSYNDAAENCKQIALQLITELKNDSNNVEQKREEFCTALLNGVFLGYVHLIEWEQLIRTDDQERLALLISEEVIAELRRFCGWIKIINSDRFLKQMNLSPLNIDKRTLRPFLDLLKDLPPSQRNGLEVLLRKAIDEIIKQGLE